MTTLDVGSGSRYFHTARGDVCLDLELNPEVRPSNFVPGDAHHLPFEDEQFEHINFLEVIEHVENPSQCLREIWRVLKPEGTVAVSTPNPVQWRRLLRHLLHMRIIPDSEHIAAWDKAELETLLRKCGFTVLRADYVCVWEREKFEKWTHRYADYVMHKLSLCKVFTGRSIQILARKNK